MDLVKNKVMFSIVSAALGFSLMLTTFYIAEDNDTIGEKENKVAYDEKNIDDSPELSSVSISEADAQQLSSSQEAVSAFANKFIVNVTEYLNVRALPDSNAEVVGKLYPGSGGDILERGEQWTKISSGNVIGYVDNQYVAFDEAAEVLAGQICPWTATVRTDTLRVRKGADVNSGTWGLAASGEAYTVKAFLEGWVEISYGESTGYLSSDYVTVSQQIGTGITMEEEQAAIKAEQERLAAIEAEKKKQEQQKRAKVQQTAAAGKFTETVQTSPYNVSESDAYLLACLVASEAGGDCYEGKLAVANIVLNRLNSGKYGNTISSVINSKNQFTVVSTGVLQNKMNSGPNSESVRAAKEALAGVNNVPGYTSFCSLKVANYDSYKAYSVIGNQVFYKR